MKIFALIALPISVAASQPRDPEMRQKMMEARFHLQETFDRDHDARVPVAELGLPESAARRYDANGDGFVTFDELDAMMKQASSGPSVPEDRSDFTHLREGGFPLNVNPEIVSTDEVEIGEDDMIMGVVINGEPRAYPVNYMNGPHNEVVNDELGGQAIAPSW